jgi:hypothetical protein
MPPTSFRDKALSKEVADPGSIPDFSALGADGAGATLVDVFTQSQVVEDNSAC